MEYTITTNAETTIVSLMGIINEDTEIVFQSIIADIKDKNKITLNFANIKSINSLGVRAWVSFLRNIEPGREIIFVECTPDVIMQINMIPSFIGKAKVESFYVNYICEVCNKQLKKLICTKDLAPKTIPPLPKCESDACGLQTEELEEEYFVFLNR